MPQFALVSHQKYTGIFDQGAIKHLLTRLLFSPTVANYKEFESLNLDQAIDKIISEAPKPSLPVNHYESVTPDPNGVALNTTWVNAIYGDGTVNSSRRKSFRGWWIEKMILQNTSIHEKLILFWHNHFATELPDYDDARMGYKYQDVLRTHALGDLKLMTKAMSLDPAMLRYLNGVKSTKTAPDENYSRELQELFTVGKGPNSKYTEDDVKAAAKVLTGYRIDVVKNEFTFNANNHDTSDKQFSAFYKNTVVKGRMGADGVKELDDLLAMIFDNNEVANFIVRRLYMFFFYYEITDEIEKNFIVPLANIYRTANYQMKPLLKAMFSSQHFFDVALRGSVIKSPLDHLVGSLRLLDIKIPDKSAFLYEYYTLLNDMTLEGEKAQQMLTAPPNVAGWSAYYQAPSFHEIWINATTLIQRVKFTEKLINSSFKQKTQAISFNAFDFLKTLKDPAEPNKLINEIEALLLHIPISDILKKQLKTDFLLAGQTSDYYWTDLYNEAIKTPTGNSGNMLVSRIKKLLTYILALPEYQLS